MAFVGGHRFRQMFANGLGCQSGPGGKIAGIDGVAPRGDGGAEGGCVEKAYEICFGVVVVGGEGGIDHEWEVCAGCGVCC